MGLGQSIGYEAWPQIKWYLVLLVVSDGDLDMII